MSTNFHNLEQPQCPKPSCGQTPEICLKRPIIQTPMSKLSLRQFLVIAAGRHEALGLAAGDYVLAFAIEKSIAEAEACLVRARA